MYLYETHTYIQSSTTVDDINTNLQSSTTVDDIEEIQNIMQRLSEEKADLYEDEVDVTACDSPGNEDNELSDVDVEDVAPPPPPRDNKRHIPGLEPSSRAAKRAAIRDIVPTNGSKTDSIPMLGEPHPPPPPAPPSRRRDSGRHRENPGIYDPTRGFL